MDLESHMRILLRRISDSLVEKERMSKQNQRLRSDLEEYRQQNVRLESNCTTLRAELIEKELNVSPSKLLALEVENRSYSVYLSVVSSIFMTLDVFAKEWIYLVLEHLLTLEIIFSLLVFPLSSF